MYFLALKSIFRFYVLPQNPNSRFKNQNPDYLDFYERGVFFQIGLD